MKISKITIKQLFGIKEWQGDGKNIELVGDNGTGKTSVIDAIRYALTNSSDREFIVKNGETEGEIYIETDNGLSIDRKQLLCFLLAYDKAECLEFMEKLYHHMGWSTEKLYENPAFAEVIKEKKT